MVDRIIESRTKVIWAFKESVPSCVPAMGLGLGVMGGATFGGLMLGVTGDYKEIFSVATSFRHNFFFFFLSSEGRMEITISFSSNF